MLYLTNNRSPELKTREGKGLYVPLNFYPEGCFTGDDIKIETRNL